MWARRTLGATPPKAQERLIRGCNRADEQSELVLALVRRQTALRLGSGENSGRVAEAAERPNEAVGADLRAEGLTWTTAQAQAEVTDLPLRPRSWTLEAGWARLAVHGAPADWMAGALARYYLWHKVRAETGRPVNGGRLMWAALSAKQP